MPHLPSIVLALTMMSRVFRRLKGFNGASPFKGELGMQLKV